MEVLTFAVALAWYSGQPFTVIVSCMYWYTWKRRRGTGVIVTVCENGFEIC